MYMRKPNPIADKVSKHVLEYLLNRFDIKSGDINNIRLIINKALNTKQQIILPEIKKNKKAP